MELKKKLEKMMVGKEPETIGLAINILKNKIKEEDYIEYYFFLKKFVEKTESEILEHESVKTPLQEIRKEIIAKFGLDISYRYTDINKIISSIKSKVNDVSDESIIAALKEVSFQTLMLIATSTNNTARINKLENELLKLWI